MQIYSPTINEVPALIYSKTLKWDKGVLRYPGCKIHYPTGHRFLFSNKCWRKKNSFHHHRKTLILIFIWGGVSVCPLYKVGAFYTIFLNPSANYLFFCKCCGWLHRNLYQNLITSAAVPLPHVLLMATCYEQSKIHHDLSLTDPHIGSLFSASPCIHMDRLNLQRLLCFFVIRPPA